MLYHWLATAVVVVHATFVAFVVVGGFLALRWRWIPWIHVPAAVWGTLIELAGWICPLTPLENSLRARAGETGYAGGFIEHYILRTLYPEGLTRNIQFALAGVVLVVNAIAYTLVVRRSRREGTGRHARP